MGLKFTQSAFQKRLMQAFRYKLTDLQNTSIQNTSIQNTLLKRFPHCAPYYLLLWNSLLSHYFIHYFITFSPRITLSTLIRIETTSLCETMNNFSLVSFIIATYKHPLIVNKHQSCLMQHRLDV